MPADLETLRLLADVHGCDLVPRQPRPTPAQLRQRELDRERHARDREWPCWQLDRQR